MWQYVSVYELQHHGIKGQKWGVRRFQNEDGSLTNAGKKRYDDNSKEYKIPEKKSKHRIKLETKYTNKGFSKEDAELLANGRIKTEKILAVTAGVTITAATAYMINKDIKYKADKLIKEGTNIQRIAETGKTGIEGNLYTSYNKNDNIKYIGKLGLGRADNNGVVQKMNLKATTNIKVASKKHAEDTFIELFKNDEDFRKNASETIKVSKGFLRLRGSESDIIDKALKDPNSVSNKELRKYVYDAFNVGLGTKFEETFKSSDKFYKELSKKGYDAVQDINDMKYNSFKTKTPTIIFDAGKKLKLKSVEQITNDAIKENHIKAENILKGQEKVEKMLSDAKTYSKIAGAAAAGINVATVAQMKYVEQYRKEHPNSKLTDKEILEMRKERR